MSEAGMDSQNARAEIADAVRNMLFISESEAPLELLPADPALSSRETVAQRIGEGARAATADAFLQTILDTADPADDGLRDYLQQWKDLFALLKRHTDDICVYRHGTSPVTIDIAAIIGCDAVIIRTEAVET